MRGEGEEEKRQDENNEREKIKRTSDKTVDNFSGDCINFIIFVSRK
jgi:hypothetical protein